MKPVVLTVLLLLAVASILSGAPMESGIVSGDTTEGGKFRYGDETCPPVILQTLQLYKIVTLFMCNYELRHDLWRNAGKTPGIFSPSATGKSAVSLVVLVGSLPAGSTPNRDSISTMIKRSCKVSLNE
jgi:hypothetical protein